MSLFQMSCNGAVMIAAIIIIRTLAINRLPKTTFFLLWNIALLRLLIPFSLPSRFSVYTLLEKLLKAKATEAVQISSSVIKTTSSSTGQTEAFPWMLAIWVLGAVILAGYHGVVYWKCKKSFNEALPVQNDFASQWMEKHSCQRNIFICQSDRISAPLTYGIFHPVILVPKKMDWDDTDSIDCILQHELTHIRRLDALVKLLLIAALCLHWFNPFVWLMVMLANQDMELSCDEMVVQRMGEKIKASYALTLINMEEKKSGITPMCSHFSNNSIEERIVSIMNMKKTSLLGIVLTAALIVGTTTAFATSAKATAPVDSIPAAKITAAQTGTVEMEKIELPSSAESNPVDAIAAIKISAAEPGSIETDKIEFQPSIDSNDAIAFSLDDGQKMSLESFTKWMKDKETELNASVSAGKISKEEAKTQIQNNKSMLEEMKKGAEVYLSKVNGEDVLISVVQAVETTSASTKAE